MKVLEIILLSLGILFFILGVCTNLFNFDGDKDQERLHIRQIRFSIILLIGYLILFCLNLN